MGFIPAPWTISFQQIVQKKTKIITLILTLATLRCSTIINMEPSEGIAVMLLWLKMNRWSMERNVYSSFCENNLLHNRFSIVLAVPFVSAIGSHGENHR